MRILALEHDADDRDPGPADNGRPEPAVDLRREAADDGRPEPAVDRRETFARLARDEAARLWDLVQDGVVRETYFSVERSAAVLVLECRDSAEAEAALATLPFVRAGLIRFEIIGLRPYPGFARLFGPMRTPTP